MGRLEERLARKGVDELVAHAAMLRASLRKAVLGMRFEEPSGPHSSSTFYCTLCGASIAEDRLSGHKPWCLCVDSGELENEREILPQRRTSGAVDFTYGGINATFTAGFSLYADGRCAEIFLNCDRSQGDLEANVRDAGILASFALQHGATLDMLIAGVTHEEDGSGSSIVGTALNLVRAKIDSLLGRDPDPSPGGASGTKPGDDGADGVARTPAPVAGSGGGAAAAVASAVADPADGAPVTSGALPSVWPGDAGTLTTAGVPAAAPELLPADPKEACNDGDPIRRTHALWPLCQACGCRHDPLAFCVDAEQARARIAEDLRTRAL